MSESVSRRPRKAAALLIMVIGLVLSGSALAQPVKAHVGHTLLSRTFADRLQATTEARQDPNQWRPWPGADLAPIGELYFPALGARRVVLDSASGEALAWGVGHVPGTAPLGSPGVAAVAGHRDGRFELLGDLNEGDSVELVTVDGTRLHYIVEERLVVDSRSVQLPVMHTGPAELILTTCWPIDGLFSGPDRLLIRARSVA